MLTWVIFSLAASLIWEILNVFDRALQRALDISTTSYVLLNGICTGAIALFVLMFDPSIGVVSVAGFLWIAASVISFLGFMWLYCAALRRTDVQRVALLLQLAPVICVLVDIVVLDQNYSWPNYLGMALVAIGSLCVVRPTVRVDPATRFASKMISGANLMAIGAALCISVSYAVKREALAYASPWTIVFWQSALWAATSLIYWIAVPFWRTPSGPRGSALVLGIQILDWIGWLCLIQAYKNGPFGAVTYISSLQVLWAVLFAALFSAIFAGAFGGERGPSRITVASALVSVLIGLYLLYEHH